MRHDTLVTLAVRTQEGPPEHGEPAVCLHLRMQRPQASDCVVHREPADQVDLYPLSGLPQVLREERTTVRLPIAGTLERVAPHDSYLDRRYVWWGSVAWDLPGGARAHVYGRISALEVGLRDGDQYMEAEIEVHQASGDEELIALLRG